MAVTLRAVRIVIVVMRLAHRRLCHRAAMAAISTLYCGAANFASTWRGPAWRPLESRHPHGIKLTEGRDIRQPDIDREELALVRAGFGQQAVDDREDFLRLLTNRAPAVLSQPDGQIDRIA